MENSNDTSTPAMVLEYRDFPAFDNTAQSNRQALTEALDKLLEGDDESFWGIFDPDVTFYEASCLPYGGAHKGLDATKRAYADMCGYFSNMHSKLEAVMASRDIVMLYQTITFEAAANGNTGTLPVAELFRFRDGKVTEWRAHYFDACLVADALRASD